MPHCIARAGICAVGLTRSHAFTSTRSGSASKYSNREKEERRRDGREGRRKESEDGGGWLVMGRRTRQELRKVGDAETGPRAPGSSLFSFLSCGS